MSCNCNNHSANADQPKVDVRVLPKSLNTKRFLSSFTHHGFQGDKNTLAGLLMTADELMKHTIEEEKDRVETYDAEAHYSACLGIVLGQAFDAAAEIVVALTSGEG